MKSAPMVGHLGTLFNLSGRVAVITGGAGLLGVRHAEAIASAGGTTVLVDIRGDEANRQARLIAERYGVSSIGVRADIGRREEIESLLEEVLQRFGTVDVLINNASNNPKIEVESDQQWSRFENFPLEVWQADLNVGLTGAFLCSQVIGSELAKRGRGVIVNVASDLSLIAPDQRLYRRDGLSDDEQPVKPVTYSVAKTGLIGLTRYLATYWAHRGVRVNSISPGGVLNGQADVFVQRISQLIPLGRMARPDEYCGAILFLCSDASSYMTGSNLVVDGGRTCW
ncbi:MAG: SDR family oxidoreductase [Isosphaeraceae bacterium]|nr:SDR family oxidoreductase [Isosphaeraceae bacterium]